MKFSLLFAVCTISIVACQGPSTGVGEGDEGLVIPIGDGEVIEDKPEGIIRPDLDLIKRKFVCPGPCNVAIAKAAIKQAKVGFLAAARVLRGIYGKQCNCGGVNIAISGFGYSMQPVFMLLAAVDEIMQPVNGGKKGAEKRCRLPCLKPEHISVCELDMPGCDQACAEASMKKAYQLLLRMECVANERALTPFECFRRWQNLDLAIRQFMAIMSQMMQLYMLPCTDCGLEQVLEADGMGNAGTIIDARIILAELEKVQKKIFPKFAELGGQGEERQ